MTKNDAEKFARTCLYFHRENVARLEQKRLKLQIARENGSLVVQNYREQAGRASVHYVDSVPAWIEDAEQMELAVNRLRIIVEPIQKMLCDLEETQNDELVVYKLRYDWKLSWDNARLDAIEKHNIGQKFFGTLNNRLVGRTVCRLDLEIDPPVREMYRETYRETVLENHKKAV